MITKLTGGIVLVAGLLLSIAGCKEKEPSSPATGEVLPLTMERVDKAFRLPHEQRKDDFVGYLPGIDGVPYDIVVLVALRGNGLLSVALSPMEHSIPMGQRQKVVEACNEWNRTQPFPRAYVHEEAGDAPILIADFTIGLNAGVSEAVLDEFMDTALSCGWAFFKQFERILAKD